MGGDGSLTYLAVFHDGGGQWYARWLKRGYRHVFVVVQTEEYWVEIDGYKALPYLDAVACSDFDLAQFYVEQGYTVIELKGTRQGNRWPWMIANCLGTAKKMLGINAWYIQTPYQLYKYLRRRLCREHFRKK